MALKYISKYVAYYIICILLLLNPFYIIAQNNSRGFNYQAIARDKTGQPIVNKDIVIEVSILSGSATGLMVWQEGHEVYTNQFGLFNIIIGQGITTSLGSLSKFSEIPWSNGDYYVGIRIDFGNGLIKMGVTKLQAVPYAMVADSVLHPLEYAAGTGVTLLSNTFSHALHTGDATGISNLSVVGLQGRTLSANAPVLNDVIKWNGMSWAPSIDDNTIYNSGTGISISGTSISHLSHSGDATGNTSLTVTGIQGRGISATAPNSGEILKWNGINWIPDIDNNTTYTAGTGIVLTGTAFSHNTHSGDVTGISSLTVTGLQGRIIAPTAPISGEVLKWTGANWIPSADLVNEYAAGPGLSLNLNTFFVLPHTHTGDVFGQTSLTVQGLQGRPVSGNVPTDGEVLKWSNLNSQWEPAIDNTVNYIAGTGIIINANTINANNSLAIWNALKLQGFNVATTTPANGEILSWNGLEWAPISGGTSYAAGTGLTLTGNTFSADNTIALWNANQLNGSSVSVSAPAANQILKWNGAQWAPANEQVFDAGTGLTLISGTFFNTGDLSSTNELQDLSFVTGTSTLNITSGTGVSIPQFATNSTDAGLVPGANNLGATAFLDGTGNWSSPVGTTYDAGTGLVLNSNTFINTGDLSSTNELQDLSFITGTSTLNITSGTGVSIPQFATNSTDAGLVPGANNLGATAFLDGTGNWSSPVGTTYDAGTGLVLNSNTFINTGDLSSTNELQDLSFVTATSTLNITSGTGVSIPQFATNSTDAGLVPGANNLGATAFLDGTGNWSSPVGTTYDAGTGLVLNSNTFINTGDLSSTNELQSLAFNPINRQLSITPAGNIITLPNFTFLTSGLVPPNGLVGITTRYLRADGQWMVPFAAGTGITITGTSVFSHTAHTGDATGSTSLTVSGIRGRNVLATIPTAGNVLGWNGTDWGPVTDQNTTYTSGTGITLTGSTFSHTAHTGDALGSSILTVVALQGRSVSSTAPAANQILEWNGSAWAPATDDNTIYNAGTGLSLNAGTFFNTGDLSSVNELQNLTYTAATRGLAITSGSGVTLPFFTIFNPGLVPGSGGGAANFLRADGSWSTPTGTTYSAGTGLTLTGGTVFSHTAHTGDARGATSLTIIGLQGRAISTNVPSVNQVLEWNGASWIPATDDNTLYSAGTGITLTANTFSANNATAIWNANQLNGSPVSTLAPVVNQLLKWNGTEWLPANEIAYAAGTGITLTANTFSHTDHTGDATGSAALTVVALQGRSLSTNAPANNDFLGWNGSIWVPMAATSNPYAAGTGITLSGNSFSHPSHTGDATGITALTVVAIQGRSVSSGAPLNNEFLGWNGSSWTPMAPTSNPYAAGSGITLSGISFSHSAHTGDVTGVTALTVVALQGRNVLTIAPAANQVLEWNGAAWAPAADDNTLYAAGTGLSLNTGTFTNTGDLSTVNELQNLIYTAATRGLDITSGTGVTLPLFSTASAVAGLVPGSTTGSATIFLNGAGSWSAPVGTSYTAGTGLSLNTGTFTNTGDLSSVNELQNLTYTAATRALNITSGSGVTMPLFATASANAGLVPGSVTGSATIFLNGAGGWTAPVGTTYTAGTGITLTGTTFSHTAHTGDATGSSALTVIALQGRSVLSTAPAANQVLEWNGAAWTPATDDNTLYAAGTGLSLNTGTFTNTGDLSSVNELQNLVYTAASRGLAISSGTGTTLPLFSTASAVAGLVPGSTTGSATIFLNGAGSWSAPVGASYTAGTGLSLNTGTFTNTGDLSSVNELQNLTYTAATRALNITSGSGVTMPLFATASANAGLVPGSVTGSATIFLNGAGGWTAPVGTTYTAGTGITLTGTTFSHTAHTGDATGSSALTVIALQGRSVLSTAPAANQVLEWNGASWAPATDDNTLYDAGIGLSLNTGTFTNTGDLSSVNELQNLVYTSASRGLAISSGTGTTLPLFSTASAVAGLVPGSTTGSATLFLNGAGSWSAPVGTTYAAGTGITLTGTTFSHTAHTGDATGSSALTVIALQGRSVLSTAPAANEVLEWDGSSWAPATDDNTLYDAGIGLSLNTGTFTNTGDLSSVNELQNLVYTAASRGLAISSGTGTTLPLFSTASAVAGLVPGSTTGSATIFLNGAGSWTAPVGTTYAAGTGITLTGTTFSHTAHTGDATGSSALTVIALQGRSVLSTAPAANEVLEWDGSSWAPAIDDNTLYDAGTGLSLNTGTFTNTGDLSSVNELQNLVYTAASRGLAISSGTGTTLPLFSTASAVAGLVPGSTTGSATIFLNGAGGWTAPVGTTYAAGTGITLTGTTFSHTAHTGDATGSTALTVIALQGRSILSSAPAANEILEWNGAAWAPATDDNTLYAAGTGITLTGTTFSHTAHTGDALGSTALTVVALQGRSVLSTAPANNQLLRWNGAAWRPSDETSYAAGTGITLSGTTFSHTAHTGDALGSANLTVVALQGRGITTNAPANTQLLRFNGTNWTPSNETSYAAGTGITLSGTTFSHTAHSGDALGSTVLTVVKLRGRDIATTVPTAGYVLTWTGTEWGPTYAGIYTAGTGLTISSNTFSHTAHTGDALGSTALTVVKLQGRNIGTTIPTDRNILTWVNSSSTWEPTLFTSLADANNDTKITVEASANEDKIRFTTNGTERMIINNNGNVGIGLTGPASTLTINGSLSLPVTRYTTSPANLTLTDSHYFIIFTAISGNIYLPAASSCPGRIYYLNHDGAGTVNLTPNGTDNINGVNANYGMGIGLKLGIISDGVSDWYIVF